MNSNFISDLALHIKEKYNLKEEELTIVFPNKRAAFYLRSKFQEIYKEEIWLPKMLSIQEAMTQWSGIQLIDPVDMLFELISIDTELYGKGDNIRLFGSMATQMAKDFDEIDQYDVDAKHLFSYVYETKQIGDWHLDGPITEKERQHLEFFKNLERYYDRLRQRLEQRGKGYYGMITRHLASLEDKRLLECVNHRKVVFAGFNALTPTEQMVIDKLFRNGYAEVVWDFDRYYVEDKNNEAGRFARSYIDRNRAWKPTVFSDELLTQKKEIQFVSAEGDSVQAKALQSLLQVEADNDIAIILADEELLVPTLNSIPDEPRYGSLKVSMGYPLRQTSLSHLVSAFFSLHRKGRKVNGGWYLWPILRIFDLEIIQVIFGNQEIAQLNRYRSFVAEKSAFVFNDGDFEKCCESQELRQFVGLLLCDGVHGPTGLLDALVKFLAFIANRVEAVIMTEAAHFLLNQVSEAGKTVNRLNDIIHRYPGYANTIEDLEVLFRLVSTNTSIKPTAYRSWVCWRPATSTSARFTWWASTKGCCRPRAPEAVSFLITSEVSAAFPTNATSKPSMRTTSTVCSKGPARRISSTTPTTTAPEASRAVSCCNSGMNSPNAIPESSSMRNPSPNRPLATTRRNVL